MSRKARIILTVVIAAVASTGSLWWLVAGNRASRKASVDVQFDQAEVQVGEIVRKVEASGVVQPADEVEVRPEVDGTVLSISVKAGQYVKAGQVLAEIDASDARVALENARASYLSAQAKLITMEKGASAAELEQARASLKQSEISAASAQRELERAEALYEERLITSQQLDSYRNSALSSQEAVRSARARLDDLLTPVASEDLAGARAQAEASRLNWETLNRQYGQLKGNRFSLRAPSDGLILAVNGKVGSRIRSTVATGTADLPLITIIDPTRLELAMDIDEIDLAGLAVGQEVTFNFAALSGMEFKGRVTSIAAEGAAVNGVTVFAVTASIDNPSPAIRPGMNADATILLERRTGVLVLPNKAIVSRMGKSAVLVPTPDGPKLQPVKVGIRDDSNTEILSGLNAGDRVLVQRRQATTESESGGDTRNRGRGMPGQGGVMIRGGFLGPMGGGRP